MQNYRPSQSLPPVVKNIMIINAIMLLATFVIRSRFGINLNEWLALYYFESDFFYPHQLITSMFMHGDLSHLFFNMFTLYMFGVTLESVWGSKRFLTYYLITGLGASLVHWLVTFIRIADAPYLINSSVIGASGAVYGVLLAFGVLFPNTRIMLLIPPIPLKAKHFVLIIGAIALFSGFGNIPGDNVAHFAHLGGMIFGFILLKYWSKDRTHFY